MLAAFLDEPLRLAEQLARERQVHVAELKVCQSAVDGRENPSGLVVGSPRPRTPTDRFAQSIPKLRLRLDVGPVARLCHGLPLNGRLYYDGSMADPILRIQISTPFGPCDVMAEVEHEHGKVVVAIERGTYVGTIPARPLRMTLLDNLIPANIDAAGRSEPEPSGVPVSVDQLFETGVEIPEGGEVHVLAVWGTPCHQSVDTDEGRRFGSFEHQLCAATVGLDETGERYTVNGLVMPLTKDDPLPVGGSSLRFGDIIALAGDYYAFYDDRARDELAWAWPEVGTFAGWLSGGDYRVPSLLDADDEDTANVLDIIARDKDANHGVAGELCTLVTDSVRGKYPARRYLALASHNFCHFGSQPSDGVVDDTRNMALRLYRAYHERAMEEAQRADNDQAKLLRAFACDAFGCHFLTDLFASGHMRVPRRELGDQFGVLIGALRKAHAMHAEDNAHGLWCAARGSLRERSRVVWRAYGDGMLRTDGAATHRVQVTEAVRLSAREVFAASRGVTVPPEQRAEWLIPHPLAAGEKPREGDTVLGDSDRTVANHYPLYWMLPTGQIARRVGSRSETTYRYRVGLAEYRDLEYGRPS